MDTKLIQITAFWKNEGDDGILVKFNSDNITNMKGFASHIENCLVNYDKGKKPGESKKQFARFLINQLKHIASTPILTNSDGKYKSIGFDDAIIALLNINWLHRRGFLKSDEYNGVLYQTMIDNKVV